MDMEPPDQVFQHRVIRLPEVLRITGISKSHLYSLLKEDDFPRQILLGKRSVGWSQASIHAWIQARIQLPNK